MKNKSRGLRRYLTLNHSKKQQKINYLHKEEYISLGYFKKQNAMDCGITKCIGCGNPRKSNKLNKKDKITIQEKRFNLKYYKNRY
jgi:ribosome-associated protein YbcJ (S4-like RNA binding protein)